MHPETLFVPDKPFNIVVVFSHMLKLDHIFSVVQNNVASLFCCKDSEMFWHPIFVAPINKLR